MRNEKIVQSHDRRQAAWTENAAPDHAHYEFFHEVSGLQRDDGFDGAVVDVSRWAFLYILLDYA